MTNVFQQPLGCSAKFGLVSVQLAVLNVSNITLVFEQMTGEASTDVNYVKDNTLD